MESEEPLIVPENGGGEFLTKCDMSVRELNKVSYIAIPLVVVSVSQYLLRAMSMMMLGHLGELALSSAAIVSSLTNVTGFSLLELLPCSTRVSNELGAGKPQAAQLLLSAVLVLSFMEFVIASTVIFFCRYILGYIFSHEKSVVYYVKDMTSLLCISIVMDNLQAVLSGLARGSGWQHIGAYVNLGAYYIVGIPTALLLGFVMHLKGVGLWGGLVAGATVQATLLGIITFRTDWEKQATEARRRIFDRKMSSHTELI